LYQLMVIPEGTNHQLVWQLMSHLQEILERKLKTEFLWPCLASAAEQAGWQAANKKIRSRKKLRMMIQVCAEYLSIDDPTLDFKDGWEYANIHIGDVSSKPGDYLERGAPYWLVLFNSTEKLN
jgi:hypothetical protein